MVCVDLGQAAVDLTLSADGQLHGNSGGDCINRLGVQGATHAPLPAGEIRLIKPRLIQIADPDARFELVEHELCIVLP